MMYFCGDCGKTYNRAVTESTKCYKCKSTNLKKQQHSDKQWLSWYYSNPERVKRKTYYDNSN